MGYELKNPFAYGKIVEGENFIGRGLMLEELKELAIKGEQTHIEGLPRMGKSSLLKRCFMEQNMFHWWVTKQKIVPIFLDGLSTPKELWYSLASKIGNILYDLKADSIIDVDDDIIYRCENLYTIEDSNVRHEKLISIFEKLKKSLNFKFITIVDEFDNAIGYKYSNNDFKKLKVLGSYSTIFTCSRRRAEYIEKKSSGTVDFCENKREFFVGVFTKEDVEVYWNHYRKYFNVLNDKQMIEYRNLVSKYAGRQPQLMNYLNSQVLDHNDLLLWCNGTITRKKEIELGYRIYVKNMFQKHMEKVEEQGLKETAINLVTSPFAGISEEKKQLLLNYTFINIVPSKVKKEYFGFDVGPMADEGVTTVITFETNSATDWQYGNHPENFHPNMYVEISEDDLQAKIDALKEYKFEIRDYPHPRSEKALRVLAEYRGYTSGCKMAEAFEIVRVINRL